MTDPSEFSWYHDSLTRLQAEEILTGKSQGTFLVRASTSIKGDFVLVVSESNKVSHYIINFKGTFYQIGEQTFKNLPDIIEFYKRHLLDTTALKEAVPKQNRNLEKVRAMYNFPGKDREDLPFKRGDILIVVKKEEEQWWRARDISGKEGMIPKPYVELITTSTAPLPGPPPTRPPSDPTGLSPNDSFRFHTRPQQQLGNDGEIGYAKAIANHVKPYDETMLSFYEGDMIRIIKKHDDGLWFGELRDKTGKFSFSCVQMIDPDDQNGL